MAGCPLSAPELNRFLRLRAPDGHDEAHREDARGRRTLHRVPSLWFSLATFRFWIVKTHLVGSDIFYTAF